MSLVATRIQNWRVLNPVFDKNMTRPAEYGALDFFVSQTNAGNSIISPELKAKALAANGVDVQMPVINFDGGVTVANTRSCTIQDAENTSALYTVVFATYAIGFTMVPAMYMNNEINYQHDFNRKMEKVTRALAGKLDEAGIAALEANKTQVIKDKLYYTVTGNDVQVPWSMRQDFLGDINPMMRANDYRGQIHLVGNAGIDSILRKLQEHGLWNDVNKTFEYADKVFHFTTNIQNEAGKFATVYAVEDGNVGVVTRVDRESLRGGAANSHVWSIVNLPLIDLPVGSHFYTKVGDQSAIGGASTADMTCNIKEYYGFSLDVAFIVAYNSDPTTIANPIIKAEVVSPTGNPMAQPVVITNETTNPVNTKEVV